MTKQTVTAAGINKRIAYLEMGARVGNACDELQKAEDLARTLDGDSNAEAFLDLLETARREYRFWRTIFGRLDAAGAIKAKDELP